MRRTVGIVLAILLAGCGGGDSPAPGGAEKPVIDGVIELAVDGRDVSVVVPHSGGKGRPLLVFLHGRGGDERSLLDDEVFDALRELGARAPVVAFPDGGEASYWHDRDGGDWGSFVVDDVVPAVTRRVGTDPRRVAIGGVSMGGFGAYDLARLHPRRFCAAGGHSPALWRSAGETAPGAFDDGEDFAEHDVVAAAESSPRHFSYPALWLDAGNDDPFRAGQEAFVSALRAAGIAVTVNTWPGGHENAYWRSHWDEYLSWYATALSNC